MKPRAISMLMLLAVLTGCGKWVGPNGRQVTAKHHVAAHYEKCRSPHVLQGYDDVYSCWIDEDFNLTLEGYGTVPVDGSCYDKIELGAKWNNDWKFGCR